MCVDPLSMVLFLLRCIAYVLTGTAMDTAWQTVRSMAVICSEGPLG